MTGRLTARLFTCRGTTGLLLTLPTGPRRRSRGGRLSRRVGREPPVGVRRLRLFTRAVVARRRAGADGPGGPRVQWGWNASAIAARIRSIHPHHKGAITAMVVIDFLARLVRSEEHTSELQSLRH